MPHHFLTQRRGGWQEVASLRGLRPPGPSGSFRLLAEFAVEEGQKSIFLAILSSVAAGLLCSFYLASSSGCKEKGPTRLGTGFASWITWGFFPFCQQLLFAAAHKPERPRAGRLFLSVTNSPCCRALRACLLDICVCRQNVRAETSIAALAFEV